MADSIYILIFIFSTLMMAVSLDCVVRSMEEWITKRLLVVAVKTCGQNRRSTVTDHRIEQFQICLYFVVALFKEISDLHVTHWSECVGFFNSIQR